MKLLRAWISPQRFKKPTALSLPKDYARLRIVSADRRRVRRAHRVIQCNVDNGARGAPYVALCLRARHPGERKYLYQVFNCFGGQSPPFYEDCFVNPLIRLFAYSFIVVFSLHTFSRYIAQ